ncbi:hypothetical protein PLICRDRAFT_138217 [Plicaturopsis crispa FD-325 SS-3]|nr:hypothetical protein PLICRDRAFT_138217 [Plicaturopsis crispa FD-325 SS-3]
MHPKATYGRNRQSIADIQAQLEEIFEQHPLSHTNSAGEAVVPGDSLVDIFRAFSEVYDDVELMTDTELGMLKQLLQVNPGLEVTPAMLLQFIATRTTNSPQGSPPAEDDAHLPDRGRDFDRDGTYNHHSRSSSNDSNGTSVYRPRSRQSSVGPPVPPKTPTTANGQASISPLDASRRQRSTPLGNAAPSSWTTKRPMPPSRRKSDAGSHHGRALSDSESASPSSFGRTPGRSRAPSNPTSPSSYATQPSLASISSPNFVGSRPHSRTQSLGYYGSPQDDRDGSRIMSPPPDFDLDNPMYDGERRDGSFSRHVSSLPMPRSSDDYDSDGDEDSSLGLVMDRSTASSTVSMEATERLEALQRTNVDLGHKLMEVERTLQHKLSDHEVELEEMQGRIEELKSELSSTKREEKELRSKERQNTNQITALESEIAKLQKNLENSRAVYQSLQKQYQEQCAESERYRNALRRRDEEVKDFQDAAALQQIENTKWAKEHEAYEHRIQFLEEEIAIAQAAHTQLDEQKQENLMLKETIDRMRFDMDEMRSSASALHTQGGGSGVSSAANSVSKSLGAELLGKMKGQWGMDDDLEDDSSQDTSTEIDVEHDDDTEGEDFVQTIITRHKRKVASRAQKIETRRYEEVKEYSDAGIQHELDEFTRSAKTQTDPEPKILTASFSIQTDAPTLTTFSTQTDPEPEPTPRHTASMEIQTDEIETATATPDEDEALASSSSTVRPPTPRAQTVELHPHDLPPDYAKVAQQDREERDRKVAVETLKSWHPGTDLPVVPIAGGVSQEAREEWKALKAELGVDCSVIDKIIAASELADRSPKDGKHSRRGRFYNIYNTYIYGGKEGGGSSFPSGPATQLLLCVGASAAVFLAMTPLVMPHYSVPGSPTYYDRAAWNSFNSMSAGGEGFSPDSTAAVWNLLGRVGGGAARLVQGWPT